MNELYSPAAKSREQDTSRSESESLNSSPPEGLELDNAAHQGLSSKKDSAAFSALLSLPLLFSPAESISKEAAQIFHSTDSQGLEQTINDDAHQPFRLDHNDPLLELERVAESRSVDSSVTEEDSLGLTNDSNDADFAAVEMNSKKTGEYEFLCEGGLTSKLYQFENKLSVEGLSREQNRELLTEVIDTVRARVIECGTAAGWSKAHSRELADAVVAMGDYNSSCAGLLKTLNNKDAPAPSQAQLLEAVTGVRIFTEHAKIDHFGLKHKFIEMGVSLSHGSPTWQANSCGPIALYYHLQLERGDNQVSDPKERQKLYDDLYQELSPGTFGTNPSRLPEAVKNATNGEFQLDLQECNNWSDAKKIIDSTIESDGSCVVKYGSSLFSQHYDCIAGRLENNGIRMYISTSGYMIPENRLAEMMSQKPYSNHIWIAHPSRNENLPEIDRDAEMRRLSRE